MMIVTSSRFWGLAGELVKSNYFRPGVPYRLVLYLTQRCNCRCRVCNIWKSSGGPELSTEEIKRILQTAAGHIRWLHLSGGELFLRNDIGEIFSAATALPKLCILQFATNGTFPERIIGAAQRVSASKIPRAIITISIDGLGADHDDQRGVPGLFDRVLAAYRGIKESCSPKVEPCLGLTLTNKNVGKLPEYIRVLNSKYNVPPRDLHVNFYHRSQIYYQNVDDLVVAEQQANRSIEILRNSGSSRNFEGFWENRYRSLYPRYIRAGQSPLICEALSGSLSIDSTGQCYPCMGYNQPLGSIKDYDYNLKYVWGSERVIKTRSLIRQGRCPGCWTPCEAFHTMFTHLLPGHKP